MSAIIAVSLEAFPNVVERLIRLGAATPKDSVDALCKAAAMFIDEPGGLHDKKVARRLGMPYREALVLLHLLHEYGFLVLGDTGGMYECSWRRGEP